MARPRVRRKTRNPNSKTTRKQRNPYNVSFSGVHPLVQKTWDVTKTLRQNYKAMGLVSSLNGVAGGTGDEAARQHAELERFEQLKNNVEWRVIDRSEPADESESAGAGAGAASAKPLEPFAHLQPLEGPIAVDERVKSIGSKVSARRTGNTTIYIKPGSTSVAEPAEHVESSNPVIAAMEEQARNAVKLQRHASEQEHLVYSDLIRKHGDDYEAMSRDMRLNKYQLSAGQLRKKIRNLPF
ncbi:ribosome biogenesis protein Nop16 [Entophlyctis helioformis]|nr:ribosome biogenesis protein Nop16 [Entophlyctis helioformis]